MLLIKISTLSCLIPLLLSIVFWRTVSGSNKWLIAHLCVCALLEITCYIFSFYHITNVYLYAIYTPVEFYLLARAIGATNKTVNLNWTVLPFTLVIALLSAAEFFRLTGFKTMNSLSTAFEFLVLVGFALHTFHRIMVEQTDKYLFSSPRFWLAAGVLLYTCGSLFSFLARYYFFAKGYVDPKEFLIIHSLLNISFQIILTQTVLCYHKATRYGLS